MSVESAANPTSSPLTPPNAPPPADIPRRYQHSLLWFNLYRLCTAGLLMVLSLWLDAFSAPGLRLVFAQVAGAYFLFGLLSYLFLIEQRLPLNLMLLVLVGGDVAFLSVLVYLSGGSNTGLALLMIPSLAGAGLISRGRLALFHAALATIGLLGSELVRSHNLDVSGADWLRGGMVSVGYFATAWLSHMLGRATLASEALAHQRGVDLENLEHVNRRIIRDMEDGVLVIDNAGRIRSHNVQSARLLGLINEFELAGPAPLLAQLSTGLHDRVQDWQQGGDAEPAPLPVADGQRLLRVRIVPVGPGRNAGSIVFLEDLARAQAHAQQLKLAALGRLTANIAHEIRNPLAAVNHAVELLLEEHDAANNKLLRIAHQNVKRIDRIVEESMQLTRRDRAHAENLDLNKTLRGVIDDVIHAESIPTEVITFKSAAILHIRFDRGHFVQIIWNLLRNAWQHCNKNAGAIVVTARAGYNPDAVLLEIVDNGPGIPAEVRHQIFEPFFTTRSGGTGLGLYLARELAAANGASLDLVDNTAGARFRLVLRAGDSPAQNNDSQ